MAADHRRLPYRLKITSKPPIARYSTRTVAASSQVWSGRGRQIHPPRQGFAAFFSLGIAIRQVGRHVARQQRELDQFLHHVDDPVVER